MNTDRNNGNNVIPPMEEDEIIEGGTVEELKEVHFEPQKHKAETARKLAFLFASMLGVSAIIHYFATWFVMEWGSIETADKLARIFNMWLPVISGFVGGAATYYFTKEK